MNIFDYNRIVIVGNNGSGKSYLSKELAAISGLPLIHLDILYWGPNWTEPTKEEWIKKQEELVSKDKWIIDGNHTSTMELRFEAADLIIFLDINRFICMTGIFKRYGKKRSDMPQYLEERLDWEFFRFFNGVWNFSKTRKRIILALHRKYQDRPFFVITSRRKMKKLIDEWRSSETLNMK